MNCIELNNKKNPRSDRILLAVTLKYSAVQNVIRAYEVNIHLQITMLVHPIHLYIFRQKYVPSKGN